MIMTSNIVIEKATIASYLGYLLCKLVIYSLLSKSLLSLCSVLIQEYRKRTRRCEVFLSYHLLKFFV